MLKKLEALRPFIGNTPLIKLKNSDISLYTKLEFNNYSGSMKDRAAYNILWNGINNKQIREETVIIESSSGNLAISLAMICKQIGLPFIPVIDPNINKMNENILKLFTDNTIKVTEQDSTGGYLLTRIDVIRKICDENPYAFWTNQYDNPDNYLAYYNTLGVEICNHYDTLDYVFVAVSSGGTITGISKRIKEKFPKVQVIAVDIMGSVIFGNTPQKRYLSGIGSSKSPSIISEALIDDIIIVSQEDAIEGSHKLLKDHGLFTGASTGAVYSAIEGFFSGKTNIKDKNAMFICADKGISYMDSIYNSEWVKETFTAAQINLLDVILK
jgi:2,3-diaminopropionate biosynthesis protein SbnA